MNIGVPSRFACLKIEDDEFRQSASARKKAVDGKKNNSGSSTKTNTKNGTNTLQKKVNGVIEKAKSSTRKSKKPREDHEKNWDEWQKKDTKFVNEVYEQQMQNAILQSKLEFEHQKKNVIITEPSQGKKKKTKTMSLDQFLETDKESEPIEESSPKSERNFFQEVKESVKKTLTKEKVEQNRKKRQEEFEEVISLAHCQEKLEAERAKNAQLLRELEEAKKEIILVKQRNTTLCSMLREGEMKDKAEVLKELERLTLVKEELTEEVANLHKLLEQERSNKPISNSAHLSNSQGDVHSLKHNNKEKTNKKKKH